MRKKYIIVFFTVITSLSLFSQEQIIPEKRIYQTPEGKLFVNRNLPVYFNISVDSVDTSKKVPLLANYKNSIHPIYLGKEGLNTFYSPWAIDPITKEYVYPKKHIVFELYGDSHPPITKIHNSEIAYSKSDTLFFGAGLKIWFSYKDIVSGVNKTYFSINGEAYKEYTLDSLTFENDIYYTLKYYSTDYVGNTENLQTVSFTIDTTKPLTNLKIFGNQKGNILSANGKVTLIPLDAFSGTAKTYYVIDNITKKVYTRPIAVGQLREGSHILKYYTQDNVKNKEGYKYYEFYIDKTPPLVMSEVIGDYVFINGKAYTSGRSQIQLSAIDNKAGVKDIYYSFDGKNWNLYTEQFSLPTDKKNLKIYYYAVDFVGNEGNKEYTHTSGSNDIFLSELDLTPPTLNHYFQGPKIKMFDTVYISPKTKIVISSSDSQSGVNIISYNINNGESNNYSSPFQLSSGGLNKISVLAIDKVENMSNHNFSVKVDSCGPEIIIDFSSNVRKINNEIVYPSGTKISIFAKDAMSNLSIIYYKLNNSAYYTYNKYLTFSKKGDYSLEIKAVDILGNYSVEKFSFKIR